MIDFPHGYVEAVTDQEQSLRDGAFAQAAQQQYDDIADYWRNHGTPRVVGQYCPWPCIDPFLVIDHYIHPSMAYLIDGYLYRGRV